MIVFQKTFHPSRYTPEIRHTKERNKNRGKMCVNCKRNYLSHKKENDLKIMYGTRIVCHKAKYRRIRLERQCYASHPSEEGLFVSYKDMYNNLLSTY